MLQTLIFFGGEMIFLWNKVEQPELVILSCSKGISEYEDIVGGKEGQEIVVKHAKWNKSVFDGKSNKCESGHL